MPVLPDGRGLPPRAGGLAALLGRLLAGALAVAVLVVGFMFSLVIFLAGLVVACVVFGWLWWKLRRTMKQMREDPRFGAFGAPPDRPPPSQGEVIEGEVLHGEWRDGKGDPPAR
jgi:hypothetical protein